MHLRSRVFLLAAFAALLPAQTYTISTVATASLGIFGVTVDHNGNVYFADGYAVKRLTPAGALSTIAGSLFSNLYAGDGGPASAASFYSPIRFAVDAQNNLYIFDNDRIRKIDIATGVINTVAGGGPTMPANGVPALSLKIGVPASQNGLSLDAAGAIYIAPSNQYFVYKVSGGVTAMIAGTGSPYTNDPLGDGGPALSARVQSPTGIAVDSAGAVYIADMSSCRIRKVVNGTITSIAGNGAGLGNIGDGGQALAASVVPYDVAVDKAGSVYFTDSVNFRVRKVTPNGIITTIAGGGTTALNGYTGPATNVRLSAPVAIAVGDDGVVYFAGILGNLWKLTPDSAPPPSGNTPQISSNGVVNGAGFQPGIVAGSWFTIQGTNLSPTTDTWDKAIVDGKLPTSLDGVSVSVGGKAAYINYVSPTQINAVAPDVGSGTVSVTVTNPGGTSAAATVNAQTTQPALFQWPGRYAVATRQDYTWAVKDGTFKGVATAAAKPGDVLILWGSGFGPTSPALPFGLQVPATQPYYTASPVTATVGGRPATVYGAALSPGFAGLYQIIIQVPAGLADGDYSVMLTVNGASSSALTMLTVQQ